MKKQLRKKALKKVCNHLDLAKLEDVKFMDMDAPSGKINPDILIDECIGVSAVKWHLFEVVSANRHTENWYGGNISEIEGA